MTIHRYHCEKNWSFFVLPVDSMLASTVCVKTSSRILRSFFPIVFVSRFDNKSAVVFSLPGMCYSEIDL